MAQRTRGDPASAIWDDADDGDEREDDWVIAAQRYSPRSLTAGERWTAEALGELRLGRDLDTTADLAFLTTAAVGAHRAGRLPRLGFGALATRHGLGLTVSLGAVFGRARRPAIRARPWGAPRRFGGLALCRRPAAARDTGPHCGLPRSAALDGAVPVASVMGDPPS
jgi:hypothetical protein